MRQSCHGLTGRLLHADRRYASGPIRTKTLLVSSATGIEPDTITMSTVRQQATRIPAKPSREAVKRAPGVIVGAPALRA